MQTLTTLIAALCLFAAPVAQAQQTLSGGGSLLLGTGAAFDGDPATLRISARGEGILASGEVAALGVLVPLTWTTAGDESFGVSSQQSLIEIPISLRGYVGANSPVRAYGDLGLGPAFHTARTEGWFFESETNRTGWLTRSAIGAQVGAPDAGMFGVIEPLGLSVYRFGDQTNTSYSFMVGIGGRG